MYSFTRVLTYSQLARMQIGVSNPEAADKARAKGVDVIENLCPKMEYQRLFGELRMGGINTGILSSRL